MNGDLSDDPLLRPYDYPAPTGAKAFIADLRWNVDHGGGSFPVHWKVRVVLEPILPPESDPHARWQMVEAMTGEIVIDGGSHRTFLYDGNYDGLYTESYGDGMFVDLDNDGEILVDPMSPEFLPFGVPAQMGSIVYETVRVDPMGRDVDLRALEERPPVHGLKLGEPAPDFTCLAVDGREMRLSALRGHPVLVYFWAAWCEACDDLATKLRTIYDRYHPEGLAILSISLDENRELLMKFQEKHAEPWPVSFQGRRFIENSIARQYRVQGTGATYLIDPLGNLVGTYYDFRKLDGRLAEMMATSAGRSEQNLGNVVRPSH